MKQEIKLNEKKTEDIKEVEIDAKKTEVSDAKKESQAKVEKKEPLEEKKGTQISKPKEKPKRTKAIVNAFDIPVSTKHSTAICRFIKRKKIQEAIMDLEKIVKLRKPVPMKGEIPHRHGKGFMSGRFPEKAAKEFIILLKSLSSNSVYHGIENPIIVEAMANIGSRPFGRKGIRRKRTHIRIVAEEKKVSEEKSQENQK